MKTSRHSAPQVNAGSMADIAFLLLIFFLVVTTISADKGIKRQLPEICPPNTNCTDRLEEQNILRIAINGNDELFVREKIVTLGELKEVAKAFLDNNGDGSCSYCNGSGDPTQSDHPKKAVISLVNDPLTSYDMYIAVQDVLTKAYYELREDYSTHVLKKDPIKLSHQDLMEIQKAYPFILSEAETRN